MFDSETIVKTINEAVLDDLHVEELPLPPDFPWGTATAAYQVEGAATEHGKGPSIWDTFTHLEPSRTNGENADVACDHYHLIQEDVKLMASFNVDIYRFSIAWSRIIPLGGRKDPVNEEGIAFYNRLIDCLLEQKIQPIITLYHWDAPQGIFDRYKAFLDTEEFMADFEHYARLCFSRFGDRVKKWITFNEPYVISIFGHHSGYLAPGRSTTTGGDSRTEPWRVGHTIILSHAAVTQQYATEFQPSQKGTISIVLNGHFYEPYDANSDVEKEAATRRLVFYIGWFGDPIFLGKDYPAEMRAQLGLRLPQFTPAQFELLSQSAPINAFYGMNHYTTKYARASPNPPADDDWTGNVEELSTNSEGYEIGPLSGMTWLRVAPDGFRKLMNWVWGRYRLPIIVSENGCPCPGESEMTLAEAVNDIFRIRYLGLYLDAISRAIYEDGIPVEGYYVWTLMDNFEWSAGTVPRFGIVHTNYDTLKRTPKNSARYLQESMVRRRKA